MRVRIDDARQYQVIPGIDHRIVGRDPRPNVHDLAVTNEHVGVRLATSGDDPAAADQHGRESVIRPDV